MSDDMVNIGAFLIESDIFYIQWYFENRFCTQLGDQMDKFLSLLDTAASDPTKVAPGLHALFMSIPNLTDDGLVAGYQTIMTLRLSSTMPQHPLFEQVRKALVNQMQQEIYKYDLDAQYRRELHERFQRITGETLYFSQ